MFARRHDGRRSIRRATYLAPVKSSALTVNDYLASLPSDRRAMLNVVRRHILASLDRKQFEERMQYGIIGYCVPHSIWPQGHHTKPELPLMYMGLSSQKNDLVVYMLFLLHNKPEREWFVNAWRASGRRAHLEVGGMGCCLRFRKVEDLSLEVIAEAIGRVPLDTYRNVHAEMLAKLGKRPGNKPSAGGKSPKPAPSKKARRSPAAKSPLKPKPRTKRGRPQGR